MRLPAQNPTKTAAIAGLVRLHRRGCSCSRQGRGLRLAVIQSGKPGSMVAIASAAVSHSRWWLGPWLAIRQPA